jgi:SAM-dependent methyltransferase
MLKSTERFSDRVQDYVRYRPHYPMAVLETLRDEYGLTSESVVADIGSGTGILTELFIRNGNPTFAVEPNREMRLAAEAMLSEAANFVSRDGTAEATELADASVDFIVAGQAFHWFEPVATRAEFARILKPQGRVALVWNRRQGKVDPLQAEYEDWMRRCSEDYQQVGHERVGVEKLRSFFAPDDFEMHHSPNYQMLDWEAFWGRCQSSSYAPPPGAARHEELKAGLRELFQRYQENGGVRFHYDTEMSVGHLSR